MQKEQYKRTYLIAAAIISSVVMWWVARMWLLTKGRFSDVAVIVPPLLTLIVTTAVITIALMLLRGRADRLAIVLASWAAFIIFFPPDLWFISVLPVFALFWLLASRHFQRERDSRQKVAIRGIIGGGMRYLLLGSFLMLSLGFYLLPDGRGVSIASVSRGVQRSLDSAYELPFVQDQLAEVPSAIQAESRRELAQRVDALINTWLGPVAPFLPPLLALVLFLSLWSVSVLIREPVLWVAAGIFWILRRTGFLTVGERDVKAEVIEM